MPRLWLLGLSYQSRVYQNVTVQDIVTDVLKQAGFGSTTPGGRSGASFRPGSMSPSTERPISTSSAGSWSTRASSYFFDHQGDKEVLVIFRRRRTVPRRCPRPTRCRPAPRARMAGATPEHVDGFVLRGASRHRQGAAARLQLPDPGAQPPGRVAAQPQRHRRVLRIWRSFQERRRGRPTLLGCATRRSSGMRVVGRGALRRPRLPRRRPASPSASSFRDDWNQKYLLIEVEHRGSQSDALGVGSSARAGRRATRTISPASRQPLPIDFTITAQPRLPGVWTAKIRIAGGPYAHLDDQGTLPRADAVRSRRARARASASKAVRMATPTPAPAMASTSAGARRMEMVMACVDGNVDRPLGLGVASNPRRR